ncbi:hypothetical protein KI387_021280, partial [Taxus chinensis]
IGGSQIDPSRMRINEWRIDPEDWNWASSNGECLRRSKLLKGVMEGAEASIELEKFNG